jgi:uncharacterized protein with PIN domain
VVTHGYWLRSVRPREQLLEVVRRFDLLGNVRPFARCPRCNALLAPVAREAVRTRVPPRSWERAAAFWRCTGCAQVYWHGTHCELVEELIGWLQRELASGTSTGPT